jgi:hypothetical protein
MPPNTPVFDHERAAANAALPSSEWTRIAMELLPQAEPDVLVRVVLALSDAAQAALAHAHRHWSARGFAFQRLLAEAAPPDDAAAVSIGGTLGAILQVTPSEAAKLQRHGPTLNEQLAARDVA